MQRLGGFGGSRPVVPSDLQSFAAFHGSPRGIGYNDDTAGREHVAPKGRDLEHVFHAPYCLSLARVKARVLASECWTPRYHCKQHFRHAHIQPKDCAAVDLRWDVDPRCRMADQFELGLTFKLHLLWI